MTWQLIAAGLGAIVGWASAGEMSGIKSQQIRAVDVFLLGPGLVALSFKRGNLNAMERSLLAFTGAATVTFNARNFRARASNGPVTEAVS